MDEYILKKCSLGEGDFFYYKNGKLHREDGPAIVSQDDRRINKHAESSSEYKIVILKEVMPKDYTPQYIFEELRKSIISMVRRSAKYYLEGEPYSSKEFEEIKAKLELKDELSIELSSNTSNSKKVKV
jgi:hypothetical protein